MNFLEALSQVESGDNDHAVGAHGEISRYQMLPSTWAIYSDSKAYSNAGVSMGVAINHMNWLLTTYIKCTGRVPTNRELAVMWNMGFTGYKRTGWDISKCPESVQDYSQRITNLMETK